MSDARLFGYSMKQWAIVFGRYPLEEPTHSGVLDCRKKWMLNHLNEPGEISIAGVPPQENWADVKRAIDGSLMWQYT